MSPLEHREITVQQFQDTIGTPDEDKTVTVKIGAPWCGPCQEYEAEVPRLITEYAGRAEFVHINFETIPRGGDPNARELKRAVNGYSRIPTIAVFRGGELVIKIEGCLIDELRQALDAVLR